MPRSRAQTPCRNLKSCGYSLVELMIALALGSLIMFSLWGIQTAHQRAQDYRETLGSLQQQGQLLDYLWFSDTEQAGFWGYRHIAANYQVTNLVCPDLLGETLQPMQLVLRTDGWHVQWTYLDAQLSEISGVNGTGELQIPKTTNLRAGMVVGIASLKQGWIDNIARVEQDDTITRIDLMTPIPVTLPARLAPVHGVDYSLAKVDSTHMGLWLQNCDGKRGLLSDEVQAWDLAVHHQGHQGFMPPTVNDPIPLNGIAITVLLRSDESVLQADTYYDWQGMRYPNTDKHKYQSWPMWFHLGQVG